MVAPTIPVIHNVDVAMHADPGAIREALARQAASPVRWVETILAMQAAEVTHVVEIGPGKVLQGLVKRIAPDLIALAVNDSDSLTASMEALA